MGRWIDLESESTAYLSAPARGAGPGVLVFHAWWGLNVVFRDLCDRLAENGFLALAPDLYGDHSIATTIEAAESLLNDADGAAMTTRATAGFDALMAAAERSGSRLGAVGFSMGASFALDLSRRQPSIAAVALFYGTDEGPFDTSEADYLGHFAEVDEWEPPSNVTNLEVALAAARRPANIIRYPDVRHWFFEPDRPEYDPAAAALAWWRSVEFLRERLS